MKCYRMSPCVGLLMTNRVTGNEKHGFYGRVSWGAIPSLCSPLGIGKFKCLNLCACTVNWIVSARGLDVRWRKGLDLRYILPTWLYRFQMAHSTATTPNGYLLVTSELSVPKFIKRFLGFWSKLLTVNVTASIGWLSVLHAFRSEVSQSGKRNESR